MFLSLFAALEKKLKSIKQVLRREASVKDAVNDILRLNDVYKTPLSDIIGGKFDQHSINPLRPMDTFQLVKSIGDLGREKVQFKL